MKVTGLGIPRVLTLKKEIASAIDLANEATIVLQSLRDTYSQIPIEDMSKLEKYTHDKICNFLQMKGM